MDFIFQGKYIIAGKIVCETGLHVGGATEGFEIGGVDNTVIRDPLTERPYIPGSSLKGKLRSLLEWSVGSISPTKAAGGGYGAHNCGVCPPCRLFGVASDVPSKEKQSGPTRLSVRDAFPTPETVPQWEQYLGEGIYTELKTENALDRVTSEANPRTMERVPAGSEFAFEFIFDVYYHEDKALLQSLFTAMHLLENSALGGSGSRGSGKVRFSELSAIFYPVEFYKTGRGEKPVRNLLPTVKDIVEKFADINWEFPPCEPTQST